MPKKTPIKTKREWLAEYESGTSEAAIAKKNKCSIRTVKKGIDTVRSEQQMQIAKAELLKGALRQHHDQLLGMLQEILSALIPPAPSLKLPSRVEITTPPVRLGKSELRLASGKEPSLILDVENELAFELLRQHLERDPVWEHINRWKEAVITHLKSRIALSAKAYKLIEKKTGYIIIEHIDKKPPEGFVWPITLDKFYEAVLNKALLIKGGPDILSGLKASPSDGYVRLTEGDQLLANAPGSEEQCRRNLAAAYDELSKSAEMVEVFKTHEAVKEAASKAKRTVEEIYLMGMMPRSCRVCSRLGS